jgi:hypothetical protein
MQFFVAVLLFLVVVTMVVIMLVPMVMFMFFFLWFIQLFSAVLVFVPSALTFVKIILDLFNLSFYELLFLEHFELYASVFKQSLFGSNVLNLLFDSIISILDGQLEHLDLVFVSVLQFMLNLVFDSAWVNHHALSAHLVGVQVFQLHVETSVQLVLAVLIVF